MAPEALFEKGVGWRGSARSILPLSPRSKMFVLDNGKEVKVLLIWVSTTRIFHSHQKYM
jgi:hypothetical protein